MDFSRLKQLVVPEGEVKQIAIGGVIVWRKDAVASYGVEITTDNSSAITDFKVNASASKTFEASFNVPYNELENEVSWTFSNLPAGLTASGATVSGTATSPGTKTVTVTVTKGSYSNTKSYTFTVYGIIISTTSLPSGIYDYGYSATLSVSKNLPSNVGSLRYYASNLPSNFSLNSSTGVISGTPQAPGSYTISAYATQSTYTSPTKNLSFYIIDKPIAFFSSDTYSFTIIANHCRYTDYVNNYLTIQEAGWGTTVSVYGQYFNHIDPLSSWTQALHGNSSSSTPLIRIEPTVVSDTQINLRFLLEKRSTALENTLTKRGATTTSLDVTTTRYASSSVNSCTLKITMM